MIGCGGRCTSIGFLPVDSLRLEQHRNRHRWDMVA
jgi:hypothetical protein